MQEATRRRYLALLGIDLWLPRDDAGPEATSAETTPAETVSAETASAETASSIPPSLPLMAAPAEIPVATAAPAPEPEPSAAIPATAPVAAAVDPADALSCSLLVLPDGLLLLAAHVTPQAPGLSGPEHALLASIASALAPGATLPATAEFHWPPPGVKLPAAAARGGAGEALVGLLAEQRRRRGLRDLLVLGEDLGDLVRPVAGRLGLNLVATPSLASMLADPARKRACWDAARPLRRG